MSRESLHPCLNRFPGAALELTPEGVVRSSNGRLDEVVGRELVGSAFGDLLDSTSQAKWRRILEDGDEASPACRWEFVVQTPGSLDLRTFLALWDGAGETRTLWLLEHSLDPELERVYDELSELHADLVESQRQLGRERARLKRALEKAEAAITTRDDVLAVVSHDLRNPVGTILLAADLLQMPIPEEQRAEQAAIITRAATGMRRLLGDLLDVGAIEAGRLRVETEPLTLEPLIEDSCRMQRAAAAAKDIRLECSTAPDLPIVAGDRDRLRQVLNNLIGNAVKFTPPGGGIRVAVDAADGALLVRVSDSGPGIEPADLPRIFDRYWHTARRKDGGAGLGLAIAKGIVDAHQGRIWVTNNADRGATFAFTVPLAGAAAGAPADRAEAER